MKSFKRDFVNNLCGFLNRYIKLYFTFGLPGLPYCYIRLYVPVVGIFKILPLDREIYFVKILVHGDNKKLICDISSVADLGCSAQIPDPGSKRHRIPDPDPQHWT